MFLILLTLIVSLVGLLISAELVVRGSVALALRAHVPPLLIGLTIVAFGTSAPELLISAQSALNGLPGLALGNVVGSNVANIFLVLGVPALIYPLATNQPMIRRNTSTMIVVSLIFIGLCATGVLVFWHGALLFTLIVIYLILAGLRVRNKNTNDPTFQELADLEEVGNLPDTAVHIIAVLILGLVGLPLSSHFLIESASAIAAMLGVSDSVIGLSIVALGTSLPELATTLSAALHRQSAMALGNVIGSNLFNLLAVMGVTAMIANIPVEPMFLRVNLWVMLASSLAIVPFIFLHKPITRPWGALFTLAYILFIIQSFNMGRL